MKGIAVCGSRGGSGKTSTAHLVALGAAWHGVPAYMFHTDDREPITVNGRPYGYFDARTPQDLSDFVGKILNTDGLCIIDSGGNRPTFDSWIASTVDLVLVPVSPDPEDVREGIAHAARLESAGADNVRFILTKYPPTRNERLFVARYFENLPEDKVIGQLPAVAAVRILRDSDNPTFTTPPSKVNNLARRAYRLVKDALEEAAPEQRLAG